MGKAPQLSSSVHNEQHSTKHLVQHACCVRYIPAAGSLAQATMDERTTVLGYAKPLIITGWLVTTAWLIQTIQLIWTRPHRKKEQLETKTSNVCGGGVWGKGILYWRLSKETQVTSGKILANLWLWWFRRQIVYLEIQSFQETDLKNRSFTRYGSFHWLHLTKYR